MEDANTKRASAVLTSAAKWSSYFENRCRCPFIQLFNVSKSSVFQEPIPDLLVLLCFKFEDAEKASSTHFHFPSYVYLMWNSIFSTYTTSDDSPRRASEMVLIAGINMRFSNVEYRCNKIH